MSRYAMYFCSKDYDTSVLNTSYFEGSHYNPVKESVIRCVADVLSTRLLEGRNLFSIADFGTADGVDFRKLLDEILGTVEQTAKEPIQTMAYFDDRVENDFNLLLSNMTKNQLIKKRGVFFSAIGRTMYEQCLPDGSLDIAVSTAALQWLSETPCMIDNGITHFQCNINELAKFKDQAKTDWKMFLLSRGSELIIGGFVIALFISDEDGFAKPLSIAISDAWRRMLLCGNIEEEEFRKAVLPQYISRTDYDLQLPFHDPDIRLLNLRLISITKKSQCFTQNTDLRYIHVDDRSKYAKAVTDYVRPWLRNTIYFGLSDRRGSDEKELVVKDYFDTLFCVFMETNLELDKLSYKEVIVQKLNS